MNQPLQGGLMPGGTAPWGSRMPVKANLDQDTPDLIRAPIKRGWPKCIPAQRLLESSAYAPLNLEVYLTECQVESVYIEEE